jgi:hypothetical protein
MKIRYDIKNSLFDAYETILFDLDRTIWDCFDARGTGIPALEMVPPFELVDENVVSDLRGNVCKLQPNVRDVLDCLDEYGMNLGVVSRSAKPGVVDEAQPAKMLLGKFDLLRFFTYIVVIKPGIDKGEYARPEGHTLFIDDDAEILQSVNDRGLVDVLSRKKFVGWENLFQNAKEEHPLPSTVQYFKNAPQPTTSALKFATPETYTDKSDIDGGIGGSSKNLADMWNINDHHEIENGRDHLWGEPFEPQKENFLDESKVTPGVSDKLREQNPNKGGLAVSSMGFEDQQLYAMAQEVASRLGTSDVQKVGQEIAVYYQVAPDRILAALPLIAQAADLPHAEQYPGYMGTMDVSPKDPKGQDELEEPSSTRKDLERQYFETDLHSSPDRPETNRPLTPFASLVGAEEPVNPELHKPNMILVHQGVLQALTFAESTKPDAIVNHEAREDYRYRAPSH